mgnify:FL=1
MKNGFKILLTYWYGIPSMPEKRITKIKNAGFKYLSLHWCDEYESSNGKKEEIFDKCKLNGLQILVFHLPFEKANDLWKNDASGRKLFSIYKQSILDAHNNDVEYVVMHLNSDSKKLENIEIGLKRIAALLKYAEELNVNIAFENLQTEDQLDKIEDMLNNYSSACLCFDVGHNNIKYSDFINLHKEKIKIMHIHDNLGKTDTHQTPFTGTVNWKKVYNLIKEINNHCLFVFEVQKQANEEENPFLKNVYLAYEKMKKDLEKN